MVDALFQNKDSKIRKGAIVVKGLKTAIPLPALRRLPLYRQHLEEVERQGTEFVSCSEIGKNLGLDPTQVRKDIQLTGLIGKPKVGHPVSELIKAIDSLLGWDNFNDAFLVGTGCLGAALLGNESLRHLGFSIVVAFDIDPAKIGREVHGKKILSLERLPGLARRMRTHIGIITVPAEAAQSVADLMIEGGIRGIWNFAPIELKVPEGVIVQNTDLYDSLAALCWKLTNKMNIDFRKG